jgi:hypothetical protein
LPDRPSYRWALAFHWAEGFVEGRGTLEFTPEVDTDHVVIRLWANAPRITRAKGHLDVAVDGDTPFDRPNDTTLVLKVPAKAHERFQAGLTWKLTLPTSATDDRVARSGDAIRLGAFLPVIAWEPNVGWAVEPPTSGFAEASLSVPADYDVTVGGLPEGVSALASGVREGDRWRATAVPDWAMSTGRFTLGSRDVEGISVTVGVDSQVSEPVGPYLDKVARVLADFNRRFGAYAYPTYTLAITPGLKGGIENPMHVMQGPGHLGRTTSHEIGHMWFYSLVSTDQGRDPWIDEGLATWAEGRFEGTTASLLGTSVPAGGKGRAGEPMTYWEPRQSIYYRSVYVQGAQAFGALGPPDAVDCGLRQLVARQSYRVTRPADVVAAMSVVFPNAARRSVNALAIAFGALAASLSSVAISRRACAAVSVPLARPWRTRSKCAHAVAAPPEAPGAAKRTATTPSATKTIIVAATMATSLRRLRGGFRTAATRRGRTDLRSTSASSSSQSTCTGRARTEGKKFSGGGAVGRVASNPRASKRARTASMSPSCEEVSVTVASLMGR